MPSAPSDAVPDKHDADGVGPSERASDRKKKSMGLYWLRSAGPPAEMEMAVDQLHLRVGRHDVHAIGRDARAFGRLDYGKRRMAREKRGRAAGVVRREVLDENNREVGIARQPLEKLRKCLESSSRRADADDAEVWAPGVAPWPEVAPLPWVSLVGRAAV